MKNENLRKRSKKNIKIFILGIKYFRNFKSINKNEFEKAEEIVCFTLNLFSVEPGSEISSFNHDKPIMLYLT